MFSRITGALAIGALLFVAGRANAAHELIYGIELSTDNLISFYSDAPGSITASRAITGLQAGESVRGIDVGANGVLYGLGSSSRLYSIDPNTGQATAVGGQFSTLLNGSTFGFDIGPTGARVTSDLGQALLINTSTWGCHGSGVSLLCCGRPACWRDAQSGCIGLQPHNHTVGCRGFTVEHICEFHPRHRFPEHHRPCRD